MYCTQATVVALANASRLLAGLLLRR